MAGGGRAAVAAKKAAMRRARRQAIKAAGQALKDARQARNAEHVDPILESTSNAVVASTAGKQNDSQVSIAPRLKNLHADVLAEVGWHYPLLPQVIEAAAPKKT